VNVTFEYHYLQSLFIMLLTTEGCSHAVLQLDPSPFATLAGYTQPTMQKRAAAEATSGRASKTSATKSNRWFPPPLVLPHDDLNYDPDCPPQSVNSWLREKARNKMSPEDGRDTLYIARVPEIGEKMSFMRDWIVPVLDLDEQENRHLAIPGPDAALFVDYIKAFYYGMHVRTLSEPLQWTNWGNHTQPRRQANLLKYVGLKHGSQCTRVRVRKAPDGAFAAQLNLEDIIDAATAILPADAYALLLLIDHDIYESEDDDFCCGRAYGGSRVAVVQSARYNPLLDAREKIDRMHMWHLSHCKSFVDELCAVEDMEPLSPTKQQIAASRTGPVKAAINAAAGVGTSLNPAQETLALWFSRLARTVSHEMGHCFGIAHCVYYACNMQSTAGMKEDVRQPPYLCPICEAKVGYAIQRELHGGRDGKKQAWAAERCEALKVFCTQLNKSEMETGMWCGLAAWLAERQE
jgi:archaemetzincin